MVFVTVYLLYLRLPFFCLLPKRKLKHLDMKKKLNYSIILILLCYHSVIGQNNSEKSLYDWFDTKFGKENLDIKNGVLFYDAYPATNNTTRFILNEFFPNGDVVYNSQCYYNVYLNYDIYTDNLLIKPKDKNDRRSIITLIDKIESFTFEGRKFINLNYKKNVKEDFIKGFYEEINTNGVVKLYCKHSKTKREVFYNKKVYYEFEAVQQYVIFYNNTFYKIDSKKSIQNVFPELKSKINNFYEDNTFLESENKSLFFKKFIEFINTSL